MSASVVKTLLAPIVVSKRVSNANGTIGSGSGEESKRESIDGKERVAEVKNETSPHETLSTSAMSPS